jgi:hypothetical protein
MVDQPKHSHLGASGMERWQNCPGSVALLKGLMLPESEEEDFRVDGTTAHAGAAWCLENGCDAWEIVNNGFDGHAFTADMAIGVQVYLDVCRADQTETSETYVEYRISEPGVHPLFYGTADDFTIEHTPDENGDIWLNLNDYKNGAGVVVEVKDNPQERYYAFGVLLNPNAAKVTKVRLRIVQPNAFHPDGPVREEVVDAEEIRAWGRDVLIPAMLRAELDDSLDPGPWCRFCPAKLVCPVLTGLFSALCNANPQTVVELSDDALGRDYQYKQVVQFYLKAMEVEVFRRLNLGHTVKGTKLVYKKADRVWMDGAAARFVEAYGDKAFTKPELLSPAQMERVDVQAKTLVKEWAYAPKTGLTVALESDKKVGVNVKTLTETFGATVANMEQSE